MFSEWIQIVPMVIPNDINNGGAADGDNDASDEETLRASVSEFGCCQ